MELNEEYSTERIQCLINNGYDVLLMISKKKTIVLKRESKFKIGKVYYEYII